MLSSRENPESFSRRVEARDPRRVFSFCAVVVAVATGACSSSSQSVTSASTAKCAVTATATPPSFSAAGGSGALAVSTNRECEWNAVAASPWIQLDDSISSPNPVVAVGRMEGLGRLRDDCCDERVGQRDGAGLVQCGRDRLEEIRVRIDGG